MDLSEAIGDLEELINALANMPADPAKCWPDEWRAANIALRWLISVHLEILEAIADAARTIVDNKDGCASGGWREGAAFLALADAVDALEGYGKG